MILLIDNYDSFTFNIYHYLGEIGAKVDVYRNDKIDIKEILELNPKAIVLSPGPCTPNEAGICLEIVKKLYSHNLIHNQWKDDTDGLEAMIQIIQKSKLAASKNIPLKRYTEIKKIIYYNYMDCRVITDILKMLREMI